MDEEKIIEAVRLEAEQYWSGADEPIEIHEVWIAKREANGEVEVRVRWSSESTEDQLRDEMIYTVSFADGEISEVFGPEW